MGHKLIQVHSWLTMKSLIRNNEYVSFQVNAEPPFIMTYKLSEDGKIFGTESLMHSTVKGENHAFLSHFSLKDKFARGIVYHVAQNETLAYNILPRGKKRIRVVGREKFIHGKGLFEVYGTVSRQYHHERLRLCTSCFSRSVVSECIVTEITDEKELFGKICYSCHVPLADWLQCALCRQVFWAIEPHLCDEMKKKSPAYFEEYSGFIERWGYDPVGDA